LGGLLVAGGTVLLQAPEFGQFLFVAARETGFLELEVAELLFILQENVKLDHAGTQGWVVILEVVLELETAQGIDGHFKTRDALATPGGIGERLDEFGFAEADGLELGAVLLEVVFVCRSIFGREQDGAAGESCFDCIQGDFGFTLRGAGTCRELSVRTIGFEASSGDHGR
jgi:hypothetical protein